MPASVTPAAPTLQQPGVVGDDLDHLHLVLGQDDVKAQQEEGDVLVDAGADDVEHGDDQNHQQQRHLETQLRLHFWVQIELCFFTWCIVTVVEDVTVFM